MSELTIHTDGGARGNPGPAAVGVHLVAGETERRHGRRIGTATNNVAEYTAVIEALDLVRQLRESGTAVTRLSFFLDSELVVKQLRGEYKVRDENLRGLCGQVLAGLRILGLPYSFTHVPRAQNKVADGLVNAALDGRLVLEEA